MSRLSRLAGLLSLIILAACRVNGIDSPPTTGISSGEQPNTGSPANAATSEKHTFTVFAAASLTDAFQEIGKEYQNLNPGVSIRFNFAGSQILRTQIEQGASADIFASADHKNMDALVAGNLVEKDYQDFCSNKLIIILPHDNPGNVKVISDLARPKLKLVLADASVPAGNYARMMLSNLSEDPVYGPDFYVKVLANVVSDETDVRQVVTKVELGEADAGIVYISDAVAAPDLISLNIPGDANVIALYPIARLTHAANSQAAIAFISYIMSPAGQATLMKWGFTPINPKP